MSWQDHLQKLGKKGLALLWTFAEYILDAIWDATWEVIFDAVEKAEEQWEEGELVKDKKKFVIEKALQFIEDHRGLNWIERHAVKLFFNVAIDGLIQSLNKDIGKNWVEKVKEREDQLDDYIPFVD